MTGRLLTLGALAAAVAGGWLVFSHYHESYRPVLAVPGESWLHDSPRDYVQLFGEHAGSVRDNVYSFDRDAQVTVFSRSDPLLRPYPLERFVDDSRAAFAAGGGGVSRCRAFEDEVASWACLEWQAEHAGLTVHQRVYLAGRGHSKLTLLFTAPADGFHVFGNPERWIRDLDWRGPGIAHAF